MPQPEQSRLTISSVKRVHGRATLTLSNGETLSMPRAMLKERAYRSGMPFDSESFQVFLRDRSYPFALEKAVSMLAMRARTEKEIAEALKRNAYPETTIAKVMAHLLEVGYLNDADFAQHWSAARTSKGLGTRRIRMELRQKGVNADVVEETVASLDEDALFEGAIHAAQKAARGKNLALPADRQKVLSALARRGFDYSLARRVLDCLINS